MVKVTFANKLYFLTKAQYEQWLLTDNIEDKELRADAKVRLLLQWGLYR
jgi:hypothetical protein